ncbi:TnsA endonuclease N-terminal domain-containing protein [Sphingomonas sp. RIT328]|uniref:TnsA endonuclease N-terminal domain-containing protein n=1 Tax=Sphingomonas sp. RIT328 TaxID=1470591 RepID=UPI000448482F|nr:TnsA endonuclease N-terminal domain-containing protein [Sphingomonas sp. RIT328]EZP52705.1 Transposon Tn7 transposition protein TnsA [Sphingomonas sp. RIT328]
MAKNRTRLTEKRIAKLKKMGRGMGCGPDYLPWVKIHDFSSMGRAKRRLGQKSGRVIHLMSDGEEDVFLALDASRDVLDIREQYPLARTQTIMIAERLGVPHPRADGVDIVMTTDFLVDLKGGRQKAIAVKTENDLERRRVREKLDIERLYWTARGIPWHLITKVEVDNAARLNRQEVAEWHSVKDLTTPAEVWDARGHALLLAIAEAPSTPLLGLLKSVETDHEWVPGTGISTLKRLLALGLPTKLSDDRLDLQASTDQLSLGSE